MMGGKETERKEEQRKSTLEEGLKEKSSGILTLSRILEAEKEQKLEGRIKRMEDLLEEKDKALAIMMDAERSIREDSRSRQMKQEQMEDAWRGEKALRETEVHVLKNKLKSAEEQKTLFQERAEHYQAEAMKVQLQNEDLVKEINQAYKDIEDLETFKELCVAIVTGEKVCKAEIEEFIKIAGGDLLKLHVAVFLGVEKIVREMLQTEYSLLTVRNDRGWDALQLSVARGYLRVTEALWCPEQARNEQPQLLLLAAANQHTHVAKFLKMKRMQTDVKVTARQLALKLNDVYLADTIMKRNIVTSCWEPKRVSRERSASVEELCEELLLFRNHTSSSPTNMENSGRARRRGRKKPAKVSPYVTPSKKFVTEAGHPRDHHKHESVRQEGRGQRRDEGAGQRGEEEAQRRGEERGQRKWEERGQRKWEERGQRRKEEIGQRKEEEGGQRREEAQRREEEQGQRRDEERGQRRGEEHGQRRKEGQRKLEEGGQRRQGARGREEERGQRGEEERGERGEEKERGQRREEKERGQRREEKEEQRREEAEGERRKTERGQSRDEEEWQIREEERGRRGEKEEVQRKKEDREQRREKEVEGQRKEEEDGRQGRENEGRSNALRRGFVGRTRDYFESERSEEPAAKKERREEEKEEEEEEIERSGREDTPVDEKHPPPMGLPNLGNTCYMNSVLQCLCHVQGLASRFRELHGDHSQGDVMRAMVRLWASLQSGDDLERSVRNVKNVAGGKDKNFRGYNQREAQEFLSQLLHWLHTDAVNAAAATENGTHNHAEALVVGGRYKEASFISNLFGTVHVTKISCQVSNQPLLVVGEEDQLNISLPVSRSGPSSLKALLDNYYRSQLIDWDCNKCGRTHLCENRITISKLPSVLVLHLSRVSDIATSGQKVRVTYPMTDLIVGYANDGASRRFTLAAVSCHDGGMKGGHYTAYCRRGGQWFLFNDKFVLPVRSDAVLDRPSAHILFYEADDDTRF